MRVIALVAALVVSLTVPAAAANRDNSGSSTQSGSSSSGDAIGGPSVGIARAGDVRVEATNVSGSNGADAHSVTVTPGAVVSTNVQGPTSVQSGDSFGSNTATAFVGMLVSPSTLADVG